MGTLGRWWPRRVGSAEPLAAALWTTTGPVDRDTSRRRVRTASASRSRPSNTSRSMVNSPSSTRSRSIVVAGGCSTWVRVRGRPRARAAAPGAGRGGVDVSPTCTELCRARGVRDARTLDVMTLVSEAELGRFDTILFGMQTIGVAGGILPLARLLTQLQDASSKAARCSSDSSELREAWEGDTSDRSAASGEIVLSTRYRGQFGDPFPWLYIGEKHLADESRRRRASRWRSSARDGRRIPGRVAPALGVLRVAPEEFAPVRPREKGGGNECPSFPTCAVAISMISPRSFATSVRSRPRASIRRSTRPTPWVSQRTGSSSSSPVGCPPGSRPPTSSTHRCTIFCCAMRRPARIAIHSRPGIRPSPARRSPRHHPGRLRRSVSSTRRGWPRVSPTGGPRPASCIEAR